MRMIGVYPVSCCNGEYVHCPQANSESIFAQSLQNKLHPSHTYSNVSGGWPLSIPDLTVSGLQIDNLAFQKCQAICNWLPGV